MTSQPGLETIAIYIYIYMYIYIYCPISHKGNQTMKFGQSIEYNKRNIFLQNYAENQAGKLVADLKKLNMR